MAIHFGNDKIKDIYVGSDKIKEVYYGSEKVWGEIELITDSYWVHYQTYVITPIYLTDPNITNGTNWKRPSWANLAGEIKLPTGITTLDYDLVPDSGMSKFPNATYIDIPSTLTNYSTNFLKDTPSLIVLVLRNPTPATSSDIEFGPNIGNLAAFDGVYVPSESIDLYKTTPPWSAFAPLFKDLVTL